MFAVFNRAITGRSSCTLWRNSSMMVATVQFYTRGVRSVHKTEHLNAVFGSVTPGDPYTTGEQIATNTAVYFAAGDTGVGFTPICGVVSIVVHGNEIES
jgi:hypothetical protein